VIADERSEQWDAGWESVTIDALASADVKGLPATGVGGSFLGESSAAELSMPLERGRHRRESGKQHANAMVMSLAEYVEQKFIPEHVTDKTPAGRAHFHGLLNCLWCNRPFSSRGSSKR
jgi:hypothetical protein